MKLSEMAGQSSVKSGQGASSGASTRAGESSRAGQGFAKAGQGAQSGRKSMEEAYEELKNCSQEELMQRLGREIDAQKRSGAFDYAGLVATLERLKMYLPQSTYENMLKIVESFK